MENHKSIELVRDLNSISTKKIDDIPVYLEDGERIFLPNKFHAGLVAISKVAIHDMSRLTDDKEEYMRYAIRHYKNILLNILLDFKSQALQIASWYFNNEIEPELAKYDTSGETRYVRVMCYSTITGYIEKYINPEILLTNQFIISLIPYTYTEDAIAEQINYICCEVQPILNTIGIQIEDTLKNYIFGLIEKGVSEEDAKDLISIITKGTGKIMYNIVQESAVVSCRLVRDFVEIFDSIPFDYKEDLKRIIINM